MTSKPLTASILRIILCVVMALVAAIGVIGFGFMYSKLQTLAETVSKTTADAEASKNRIAEYKLLREKLENQTHTIDKVTKMVAESQSYTYQDQIIADINNYAKKAGISITSISFGGADIPSSGAAAPTSGGTASTAPKTSAPTGASGLKTASATVTLENPVDYRKLLTFMHYIEQNLTKMQIANVSLSKSGGDGNQVTTNALTINVYVR